jgi:hypothetical protein
MRRMRTNLRRMHEILRMRRMHAHAPHALQNFLARSALFRVNQRVYGNHHLI